MKKPIGHVLIVLFLAISISAQEKQPRLIDEFPNVPLDETMARVDNLVIEMDKAPNSEALIRVYGGTEYAFASAYARGSVLKSMWITRKYPLEKLSIQFCNVNGETMRTQFFLVEKDDKIENCAENLLVPKETVLITLCFTRRYLILRRATMPPSMWTVHGKANIRSSL